MNTLILTRTSWFSLVLAWLRRSTAAEPRPTKPRVRIAGLR